MCVELYRQGKWVEKPEGVSTDRFHHAVVEWHRLEKACGTEVLRHKKQNKVWTAEEKYELVAKVLAGASCTETAISDQGWQHQHAFYRGELQKHGIIQSMSRKGNCYDNCMMETFFGRLKNEMFYGFEKNYHSFEAFSMAIAEYISYYNNSRIQAKTKWMPSSKFREASMIEA